MYVDGANARYRYIRKILNSTLAGVLKGRS